MLFPRVLRGVRRTFPFLAICLVAAIHTGCGARGPVEPTSLAFDEHASGNNQCAMHDEVLTKPLRVAVYGPPKPGLLGGKGTTQTAPGAEVTFRVTNPGCGAVFVANESAEISKTANAAGMAVAQLRVGHTSGDVNVLAAIRTDDGEETIEFRALAGVERIGTSLEGPTGGKIDEFGVRLQDSSGAPAVGVTVYFRVEGSGENSAVGGKRLLKVLTDEEGKAVTSWRLGKKIQQYFTSVEILDKRADVPEAQRFHARAVEFEAMAVAKKQMAVQLFGGLAVFIFGMKLMSGGLRKMADRRLKSILQAMTRNRFMATGVGAALTAMVQSSSATTVMTVGFVNAGLMTLTQAIGVVYGANIGTTVTGQIIAFKLDALAYPAIAIGLILTSVTRRTLYKNLGEAILGFGLLFLGMTTMSAVLKPLQHSPEFVSLFQLFDCTPDAGAGIVKAPQALMCILIGTAATVAVQSSSATVGLVLALSGQGLLSFYTAVPLILGDNIGTTITAILASIGANRNARRTALAHTMFNVFGAGYMYVLLLLPLWNGQPVFLGFIDWLTPGEVFSVAPENLPRHVANAHTFFNVFNVVLFLPFVPLMARVCQRIVPVTVADEEQVLKYLEPHLLNSPSLAVQQAVSEVSYMLRRSQKSINDGCEFFYHGGRALEEKIAAREELIDRLQHEITAYLVDLSRQELTPTEAALIPALIHAVNDAERIGDHSEDLVELGHLTRDARHDFSGPALEEVRRLQQLLNEQFQAIYQSFEEADPGQVAQVLRREESITQVVQDSTEAHVHRLESGECEVQAGVVFLDFVAHLERVGDRLVNIAERAGKIVEVTGT